jgi:hypothetical protein
MMMMMMMMMTFILGPTFSSTFCSHPLLIFKEVFWGRSHKKEPSTDICKVKVEG